MTRNGAGPHPTVSARGLLITEHHSRYPVRGPLLGAYDRREQRDNRRTDGCCEVCRTGIGRDDYVGAREDGGQLGHGELAAKITCVSAGDEAGQSGFIRGSGDHDPMSGRL